MTDPTPTEATPETDGPLIRTLIVVDHPVVRSGLRKVLEAESDIEVVGEAGDARYAVFETRAKESRT